MPYHNQDEGRTEQTYTEHTQNKNYFLDCNRKLQRWHCLCNSNTIPGIWKVHVSGHQHSQTIFTEEQVVPTWHDATLSGWFTSAKLFEVLRVHRSSLNNTKQTSAKHNTKITENLSSIIEFKLKWCDFYLQSPLWGNQGWACQVQSSLLQSSRGHNHSGCHPHRHRDHYTCPDTVGLCRCCPEPMLVEMNQPRRSPGTSGTSQSCMENKILH